MPHLVEIELEKLNKRLQHQNRNIQLSPQAKEYFYKDHDIRYGARHLARKIRTELEPILAIYFLNHPEKNHLELDYQDGHFKMIEMN